MNRSPAVRRAPRRGLSKPSSVALLTREAVAKQPDPPQRERHAGCLRDLEEAQRGLQDTVTQVIAALVAAIEMKDRYTFGHSLREAMYAATLAEELRLPEQQVEDIRRGALLHDIGKIFVSERILRKADELSDEEFESVKKHSALGAAVVSKVKPLEDVAMIVRHHHERWDGSGYPDALADERIPLGARVVAVVDAFGAMTEDRPYRKMLTLEEALGELERHAGGQFDPEIVAVFVATARRRATQWPMPDDGNILLAEVLIDGTLTYEPAACRGDGRKQPRAVKS